MKKNYRWTDKEIKYIREIAPNTTIKDITKKMSEKFNYEFRQRQITAAMRRYDAHNGLNPRFEKGITPWNKGKKGQIPWNKGKKMKPSIFRSEIGTEHIDPKGYTYVKIENPDIWKLKHHIIYEKHYGKIEKGYCIIFADKNKSNFNIDNLVKIKNSELLALNTSGLFYEDADLTKTGVNLIKLISKSNELNKKANNEQNI